MAKSKNNRAGNLDISDAAGRREPEERQKKKGGRLSTALSVWEQLPSRVVAEFNQFLKTDGKQFGSEAKGCQSKSLTGTQLCTKWVGNENVLTA